jgi:pimeloyl-ACP methyl ester carboxylesterase
VITLALRAALVLPLLLGPALAQAPAPVSAPAPAPALAAEALGIALEGFPYPHPVATLPITLAGESQRMAYMDVAPTGPANGRAVLLLHGRNFPASYWEPVIAPLAAAGYRVVVPDQIGFGKSAKPGLRLGFDALARNTAALLDRLGLARVDIVAHSMGGMLAARFARTYPERVQHLVLEAPIGLEDYRLAVPPVETATLVAQEKALTADGYRRQLVTNYAVNDPAVIEPFVTLRERVRLSGEYERWVVAFANTYQTLYREPVVHEIPLIAAPTLFVMGANDHNAPGRPLAPPALRAGMGENAANARALAAKMPAARAVVLDDVGHLVHLEATELFNARVLDFLAGR